jgi:micrococcal nuclease
LWLGFDRVDEESVKSRPFLIWIFLIWICGISMILLWSLPADSLETAAPLSTLPAYVPTPQPGGTLSSLSLHCDGCTMLVPDNRQVTGPRSKGCHRPPHLQGSRFTKLKSGKHLKLKSIQSRPRPVQLPRRSLTRLGLMARHFESWQVQAVDGDTIRYGSERIRLRGFRAGRL